MKRATPTTFFHVSLAGVYRELLLYGILKGFEICSKDVAIVKIFPRISIITKLVVFLRDTIINSP